MTFYSQLEAIATEFIEIFEIHTPPVPIEIMLQRPKNDMWEEVDISELSVGFLKGGGHFSPRMSLARLLARHVVQSEWGAQRGLPELFKQGSWDEMTKAFARMLIMPIGMIKALTPEARTPLTMSMHFEVPEDDAKQRLDELNGQI